jgi:hypothetical protein
LENNLSQNEGNFFNIQKIATDSMRASALLMDPEKKINNFEVFGMDFMIDEDYNVWLI